MADAKDAKDPKVKGVWTLTNEGESICTNGSYEARLWRAVEQPTTRAVLSGLLGREFVQIGLAQAVKRGWVHCNRAQDMVTRAVSKIIDDAQIHCQTVRAGNAATLDTSIFANLKTRRLAVYVLNASGCS